ncbi:MAG: ATP-binding protein [Chloroflexi bacterium]|nr:ATP-binding protein [Chloroflexota bacterium]
MTNPPLDPHLIRYQRLLELTRHMASTLDLDALLNMLVHAAAELCSAEAASILLYDEAKRQLYFEAATNLETPLLKGLIVPVESSIAGWIIQERQPIIISDAQKDPRHFSKVGQTTKVQTRSLLGVPLIAKDQVIGVLEAINKLQGNFTEADQEVLIALGAQAAVAIENARLFQQSDLISELVHELRTPLAALNTATHLLQRPQLKPEQRANVIRAMESEINRLTEMSTAFLDLARLESGRSQYQVGIVDLKAVLEDCCVVMRGKFEEKGQTFRQQLAANAPAVRGDADKLKQVILNLLSNAYKYTPAGGTVTLALQGEVGEAVITVCDSGAGIPAESLGRIFEKFYRVPRSEQSVQGTGLGLSICKRIVEAHEGRIEVDNQPGGGARFTVRLPAAKKTP